MKWSARRHVAWLVPLALVPLAGAWGLHSLKAYADQRTTANVQLRTLSADFNRTAADLAWAVTLHLPSEATDSSARADAARVVSDIAGLRATGIDDPAVVEAERTSATFLATLQSALPVLDSPGFDPASPAIAAAVARAITQRTVATSAITAASDELMQQSSDANGYAELGNWVIVLAGSALLVWVMWRAEARTRRSAVDRERRRTLTGSERTYRMLFDRNPAPMAIYDPDTLRFLSVNDAATVQYGWSRAELLTMTVRDILPEENRASFKASSALDQARPTVVTTQHLLRDGRIVDVEVNVDDITVDGRLVSLVLVRDVTNQRRLEAELQVRAFHDALTGLGNRALLTDRFEHAQAIRARSDRGLALLVLDLDGFKATNDAFGHGVGDEVLRAVGTRLRGVVRAQDTVVRLGGDEFAVLIEGCEPPRALELAIRVITAVGETLDVDGSSIEVTPSAGLATVDARDMTLDAALQHADIAMYEAKRSGMGRVQVFASGMRSDVLERLEMASDLRRAVARDELVLHYQPIVATMDPAAPVDHVEALVRWRHPVRGMLPPCDFIPVAEQSGVIVAVGAWVLRAACEQLAVWERMDRPVSVSVNVSSRELREPTFAAAVAETLRRTGVSPRCLTLEVTETVLLEDLEQATRVLEELRALGVQVALDDFGAGYSSLAYLDHLPVDVVKIDRGFVAGIGESTRRATFLTIAQLLRSLHVLTVAEGVETREQLDFVASLGIDLCQGYLFSPAVPAEDVLDAVTATFGARTPAPAAA